MDCSNLNLLSVLGKILIFFCLNRNSPQINQFIMKVKLLTLFALGLFFFSCTTEEDIDPEVLTQSQWMNVVEGTTADRPYEHVFSIEFEPNGKVYSESFFRDLETN